MPQLTLVKIPMAQDTSDSRRQAADLLEQLYDTWLNFPHTGFKALRAGPPAMRGALG
jgi:hypothetical protein